jgi:hypothetical protein
MRALAKFACLLGLLLVQAELTAQPTLESGSVIEAAGRLKAGEFIWAPDVAPEGPVLLVVSLATQRAIIYRNGVPIGISTVSTGRPGHRTPTGVFTVLQRQVEHYSSLYNAAPMPYMQRITWGGVALHGGHLPGYPASHGCIRLPHEFARLLYGVTRLGMTVIVTDQAAVPRVGPADALLGRGAEPAADPDRIIWNPEASPTGPVSIVISAADQRLVVLRNGRIIARAPVTIEGAIGRTTAYILRRVDGEEREWLSVALPGQAGAPVDGTALRGRIRVSDAFRQSLEPILRPGATVVVTPDSLRTARAGRSMTVVDSDRAPSR